MRGAPSIAVESGRCHLPGSGKCSLAQLSEAPTPTQKDSQCTSPGKPTTTESVRMIAQSSKLAEALECAATPSMFHTIDLATPSPALKKKAPKPKASPASPSLDLVSPDSKTATPTASKVKTPSPVPVARQLMFPPTRKPTPSQASKAPKPEGYWKLLAEIMFYVTSCSSLILPRILRPAKGVAILQAELQG